MSSCIFMKQPNLWRSHAPNVKCKYLCDPRHRYTFNRIVFYWSLLLDTLHNATEHTTITDRLIRKRTVVSSNKSVTCLTFIDKYIEFLLRGWYAVGTYLQDIKFEFNRRYYWYEKYIGTYQDTQFLLIVYSLNFTKLFQFYF